MNWDDIKAGDKVLFDSASSMGGRVLIVAVEKRTPTTIVVVGNRYLLKQASGDSITEHSDKWHSTTIWLPTEKVLARIRALARKSAIQLLRAVTTRRVQNASEDDLLRVAALFGDSLDGYLAEQLKELGLE